MSSSRIDFSAQCGGLDADEAVLPHFTALKAASRELRLDGFPFPLLAFILRVDGEVNRYHLSGAGNVDIDRKRKYLSVDIGISQDDRERIPAVVSSAILSSVQLIKDVAKKKALNVDFSSLDICLSDLIARYKTQLPSNIADNSKS